MARAASGSSRWTDPVVDISPTPPRTTAALSSPTTAAGWRSSGTAAAAGRAFSTCCRSARICSRQARRRSSSRRPRSTPSRRPGSLMAGRWSTRSAVTTRVHACGASGSTRTPCQSWASRNCWRWASRRPGSTSPGPGGSCTFRASGTAVSCASTSRSPRRASWPRTCPTAPSTSSAPLTRRMAPS